MHTNERGDDEDNVKRQTSSSRGKEMRNGMNSYNDGGNSDGEKQLNTDNHIYLPNKRPPQLRALQHHRVQRLPAANLHVIFPVRLGLGPHLSRNGLFSLTCLILLKGWLQVLGLLNGKGRVAYPLYSYNTKLLDASRCVQ